LAHVVLSLVTNPDIFLMDVVGTDCGVLRFLLLVMTAYSLGWLNLL
jgi:hypothetical protein